MSFLILFHSLFFVAFLQSGWVRLYVSISVNFVFPSNLLRFAYKMLKFICPFPKLAFKLKKHSQRLTSIFLKDFNLDFCAKIFKTEFNSSGIQGHVTSLNEACISNVSHQFCFVSTDPPPLHYFYIRIRNKAMGVLFRLFLWVIF